jgi:tetratricopeptide (TPR) repeat protein
MMDDLQQAYSAYQQALYHLRDPKVGYFDQTYLFFAIAYKQVQEPKLWYGIGILYDRYGSLEHAEEAFSQVMRMQPDFEKANEIYFRLGIIYKQQQKYQQSLEVCLFEATITYLPNTHCLQCFRYIVSVPPTPLTEEDIWFQIGHVHEQQKDVNKSVPLCNKLPNHKRYSMTMLNWLIDVCSIGIRTMQRSFSSLAGCITNKATASAAKSKRLSTLKNPSVPVRLVNAICPTFHTLTRGRSK